MRIAVVHSFYRSDRPSGENVVVRDQVEALRRAGHDVRLFARSTDDEAAGRLYSLRAGLVAAGFPGPEPQGLDAYEPDIVHVHNLFPNWGSQWLRKHRERTVATLHNYRSVCSTGLLWREGHDCTECLDRGSRRALVHGCYRGSKAATVPLAWASRSQGRHYPTLRFVSRLVVLNQHAAELFRARTIVPVEVVPNFARIVPRPPARREGLVFVGRLSGEKGVVRLVEQSTPRSPLTIIGDGPQRADIESLAKSRPWVSIVGPVSRDGVITALSSARALVIPSLCMEGVPTVALEALNCGTPLLVSDYCTAARELTAGEAGVVYSPDDTDDLMAGWTRLQEEWDRFAERALVLGRATYSEEAWVESIGRVYARVVLDGRRKGGRSHSSR